MRTALVIDDHPFIRASVKVVLKQERYGAVTEASDGVEGLLMARRYPPDLVVLDISLPGMDGMEVITRLLELESRARIVILTSQPAEHFSMRCMKLGAMGFVSKGDDLNELRKAVTAIASGFAFFPEVSFSSVRRSDCMASEAQSIARLTNRELAILQHLARGMSNKTIGDMMMLSNKTISTYKYRLIEKLRVGTVVELADFAKRNSLV
jgi:two-component system response regulator EvgA